MQEGLWLHNMYLMNTNLWTFGATTGYNESFGQNQQWTKKRTMIAKMLLYLATYRRSWLQGRRFENICKSFKLVGTYQSNPLNKMKKKNNTWKFDEVICKTRVGLNHLQPLQTFQLLPICLSTMVQIIGSKNRKQTWNKINL
jgi:hypothetical protein